MNLLAAPPLPSLIGILVIAAIVVVTVHVIRNWGGHSGVDPGPVFSAGRKRTVLFRRCRRPLSHGYGNADGTDRGGGCRCPAPGAKGGW